MISLLNFLKQLPKTDKILKAVFKSRQIKPNTLYERDLDVLVSDLKSEVIVLGSVQKSKRLKLPLSGFLI